MWIDRPEEKPTSVWQRKFPRIGLCLIVAEALLFLFGPAVFYYGGLYYKGLGATEASRFLLNAVPMINPWDKHADMAKHVIKTYLPRYVVPPKAVERNIEAFNTELKGDRETVERMYHAVMHDYPKFEWPYGNLARYELDANDPSTAEKLCNAALEINPNYLNARKTLALVYFKEKKFELAAAEIERVTMETPDDDEANMLAQLLSRKLERPIPAKECTSNILDVELREKLKQSAAAQAKAASDAAAQIQPPQSIP